MRRLGREKGRQKFPNQIYHLTNKEKIKIESDESATQWKSICPVCMKHWVCSLPLRKGAFKSNLFPLCFC